MEEENKKVDKKKELIEFIKDLITAVVIALIILFFFNPILVKQESMVPTFNDGDYVVISTKAYKFFGEPKRGDVVVFNSSILDSKGDSKKLIKRVIALPGEEIEIIEGNVYIDGILLEEDYIKEQGLSYNLEKTKINEGEIFVMGDNREVSLDSRSIGPISIDSICGRVVFRFLPLKNISSFKRLNYE